MRYSLNLAIVALTLCAAVSFAAEIPTPTPGVVRLLPSGSEVAGWEVYPDTLVYAAGESLTEIYDGGYELYTKNGVVDAAQQVYRRGKNIATLTTHRMTSMSAAKKFYKYWQKSDKKQKTYKQLRILTEAYVYSADGSSNGYLYRGKFFVTVSVNLDGDAGRKSAEAFLRGVSAKYWTLTRRMEK